MATFFFFFGFFSHISWVFVPVRLPLPLLVLIFKISVTELHTRPPVCYAVYFFVGSWFFFSFSFSILVPSPLRFNPRNCLNKINLEPAGLGNEISISFLSTYFTIRQAPGATPVRWLLLIHSEKLKHNLFMQLESLANTMHNLWLHFYVKKWNGRGKQ